MKFTQSLTMHLNGGKDFSALQYKILCDGKPTNIIRVRKTGGSPKYLITSDIFACGKEEFDNLAAKGVGLQEWLERMEKGVENLTK